jgi:hypothetical protein
VGAVASVAAIGYLVSLQVEIISPRDEAAFQRIADSPARPTNCWNASYRWCGSGSLTRCGQRLAGGSASGRKSGALVPQLPLASLPTVTAYPEA